MPKRADDLMTLGGHRLFWLPMDAIAGIVLFMTAVVAGFELL